ncbi:MAG: efflux RND transporter periplasmic adaptor subunit [Gammaproteobacteria bacterium]|nr:efflux RND transporter periplasmic adaptor subunit [Gammaproteobacteria bacterium]
MKPSLILALSTLLLPLATAAAPALETARAEHREIPLEHRLDGVVEAVNQGTLSAQTQGQVLQIMFDVDDFVEKGDIVIRLRDTEHQTRLTRAKAELGAASARLDEARKEQQRIAVIYEKKLVSSSTLDQADTSLEEAISHHKAAVATLWQANEQLEYTWIKAPFSGIVTQRHIEVGDTANPGQRLMSGVSLDRLRVSVNIPQSLTPTIRNGGEAKIILPDNQIVKASKLTIFPFAHSGSNTFKARLGLPENISGLYPGMFIKAAFLIGKQKRLLIPQRAVVFRGEVTGAYVITEPDKISFRYIRPGKKSEDGMISILAGLDAGEMVALDPVAAGTILKQQTMENDGE